MQINRLEIENFRKIEKFSLDLDKVNVFVGNNGAGKTTALDSLSLALTNRNCWNQKNSELIREGFSKAEIHIYGTNKLSRLITKSASTIRVNDSVKFTESELTSKLGITKEQIYAVLNTKYFFSLPHDKQKDILLSVIGADDVASKEDIIKMLKKIDGYSEFSMALEKELPDSGKISDYHDAAYNFRGNYKKSDTANALSILEEQQAKLASMTKHNEMVAEYQLTKKRVEDAKKYIIGAKEDKQKIDILSTQKAELEEDFERESREAGKIDAKVDFITHDIEVLKSSSSDKVTCPYKLDCSYTPDDLESAIKEKTKALRDEKKSRKAKEADLQSLRDAIGDIDNEINKLAHGENIKWMAEAMRLKKQFSNMDDPGDLHPQEDLMDVCSAIDMAKTVIASSHKDNVWILDNIVNFLSSRGEAKEHMLQKAIGKLCTKINSKLKKFGYLIDFFKGGVYSPSAKIGKENLDLYFPIEAISDGERAIISIILQDALSEYTKMNIVICDNLDQLDKINRDKLIEICLSDDFNSKCMFAFANDHEFNGVNIVKL